MTRRRIALYLHILLCATMLALLVSACQTPDTDKHVTVVVDGQQLTLETRASTVRELLDVLDITIGPFDRVEPDVWQETVDDGVIIVVRVEVQEEVERQSIAFRQKVIKSEALAVGDRKLLQLGSAGQEETVYRVVLEDGERVERVEVLRRVVEPPLDEIIAVGMETDLPSVAITGTIAYISGGNAWMMRDTSASRRPLTSSGDLDGRVLTLSPDGDWLIYSRVLADSEQAALNSLWIVGTSVLNEEPQPLGIEGAIFGEWMNDSRSFIYSTAERIGGAPGWKAHNDLWRARVLGLRPAGRRTGEETITTTVKMLIDESAETLYSWWGTNYALSPDNRYVAYGRPGAVGVLDLRTGTDTALLEFPVYHTYSEWVWLPELAWSPDGQYIVCSAHGQLIGGGKPEDSPIFDVWILDREGGVQMLVVHEAGMWSAPDWAPTISTSDSQHENYIAYGQAHIPRDSQNSRSDLYVMDRDGSNRRKVFPPAGTEGLVAPDLAWSPDGRQMVIAHGGNLFLIDVAAGAVVQLTSDGHSGQPRWAG